MKRVLNTQCVSGIVKHDSLNYEIQINQRKYLYIIEIDNIHAREHN